MTNFDRWLSYTSGLCSPQNYIEWSYRYMIGAALQRRVWLGPEHQQCFPNTYIVLVGPPGVGKGLVIKEVSIFLKHWKLKDAIKINLQPNATDQQQIADAISSRDLDSARTTELQCSNKRNEFVEPLLIPVAADTTTYEALVMAVANSLRHINYTVFDEKLQKNVIKAYGHSSLCFCLQELGSLMRKKTEDVVRYLLGLYDCPMDYHKDTLTQGKDRVRKGCLNLIAGTQPSFMQEIFNDHLINDGFSSRTFFIYASKNRFSKFFIPPLTVEQLEHKRILLDHIRQLTTLYGQIKMDDDTVKFLEEWWSKYNSDRSYRSNRSTKLQSYYARKNIHVQKIAIAEHFSESLDLYIPIDTFKKAIHIADEEEKNMHLAIVIEGRNPVAIVARKILEFLESGKKNYVEILVETSPFADKKETEEALEFLQETNQVIVEQETDEDIQKQVLYWRLK